MMKLVLIGISILLLAGLGSCSNKGHIPGDVMGIDKMSGVLLDMQEADAYNDSYSDTAFRMESPENRLKIFYAQILQLHDVSKEDFISSYSFYEKHPDLMKKLYQNMQKNIDRKKASADSLANAAEWRSNAGERMRNLIKKWKSYRFPFQRYEDSIPTRPPRVFRPENLKPLDIISDTALHRVIPEPE